LFNRTKSKFGNKPATSDGYSFASKGERNCYEVLKLMEKSGEIKILQTQAQVELLPGINYKADFKIFDNKDQEIVWIEFKGFETEVWKLKRKLWKFFGPGRLRVYKGYGLRITQTEELIPYSGMRIAIEDLYSKRNK
jgi:Protein of unknown function (DUF1064)